VLWGVAAEFLAIGLLAGVLATAGATIGGYLLAVRLFELDFQLNVPLLIAGPIVGMAFVGLAGMLATWRVIRNAPVSVLRAA
jgi:putative ABC transport system permease protein